MAKTSQLYTVRNLSDQFIGTYYATSTDQAVQRHLGAQATYAATFRRSHGIRSMQASDYKASVEAPVEFKLRRK